MAEDGTTTSVTELKNELTEALSALDLALLEAGRSVSLVRNNMTRVLELAEHAAEMEAAIVRAREQLNVNLQAQDPTPQLRALPDQEQSEPEATQEPIEAVQEPDDGPAAELVEGPQPDAQAVEPAPGSVATTTRCLRLKVSKKSGSLDLKDVDRSVNENTAVVDVALLDYDGRQATLKLWVNEKSDQNGVREALLTSLRNHLGETDTELDIDYDEEEQAA